MCTHACIDVMQLHTGLLLSMSGISSVLQLLRRQIHTISYPTRILTVQLHHSVSSTEAFLFARILSSRKRQHLREPVPYAHCVLFCVGYSKGALCVSDDASKLKVAVNNISRCRRLRRPHGTPSP